MITKYFNRLSYFINLLDDFIEPESKEILKDKITGVVLRPPEKREFGKWNLNISPDFPLRFKPCEINGNNVQVDFSCIIQGDIPKKGGKKDTGNTINSYNILIRIWSLDEKLSYRPNLDAESIGEAINDNDMRRVMLRVHIDKRSPSTHTEEPLYHMHFGGNSKPDELSWFPKSLDSPRFNFFPFDIILATEFILNNFFSLESYALREEPVWKNIVYTAQEVFLKPCITEYYSFLSDNSETFLTKTINWN